MVTAHPRPVRRGEVWLAALDPTQGSEIRRDSALPHRLARRAQRASAHLRRRAADDGQPSRPVPRARPLRGQGGADPARPDAHHRAAAAGQAARRRGGADAGGDAGGAAGAVCRAIGRMSGFSPFRLVGKHEMARRSMRGIDQVWPGRRGAGAAQLGAAREHPVRGLHRGAWDGGAKRLLSRRLDRIGASPLRLEVPANTHLNSPG